MFYCIEKELQWREAHGKPRGFEAMLAHTPLVAIGAEAPLEDQKVLADYYRMCSPCLVRCYSANHEVRWR